MHIKYLRQEDIPELNTIVRENYPDKADRREKDELEAMFGSSPIRPRYLIAWQGKEIVGFGGFTKSWMDHNVYQIFAINVRPVYQKRGVGKEIVLHIIEKIKKDKEAQLILLTASVNKNLPKYYAEHLGFRTIHSFNYNYQLMVLDVN